MPWGRMDDKFHRNPKVRALRRDKGGRDALGVWVYWWSWCLDDPELTGFVPLEELPPSDAKAAKLLVDVGLWDADGDGYRFHDFAEYNPSREKVDAKKQADRERVAAKRRATRENVARDTSATSARVASTRALVGSPHPVPARPDPIPAVAEPAAANGHSGDDGPVSTADVAGEWASASQAAGSAALHAEHSWRQEFETIASACNVEAARHNAPPRLVLLALCRWFWLAPDGPIQAGRVPFGRARPSQLAKDPQADIDQASAWWERTEGGSQTFTEQLLSVTNGTAS